MIFEQVYNGIVCRSKKLPCTVFISSDLKIKILPLDQHTEYMLYFHEYDADLSNYDLENIFYYENFYFPKLMIRRSDYSKADKILLPILKKIHKLKNYL